MRMRECYAEVQEKGLVNSVKPDTVTHFFAPL